MSFYTVPRLIDEPIQAILLFGSRARGDADDGSDTDLAVFADASSRDSLARVKREFCAALLDKATNVSTYSTGTAHRMAREGSLFLWHLKYEGKVVFSRGAWLGNLLEGLEPYRAEKAARDLRTFQTALDDIGASLVSSERTLLFEAATLFSVLRSIGMIVTALVGRPYFGRLTPVRQLQQIMGSGFPLSATDVDRLLAAKLIYSRKSPSEQIEMTREWCVGVLVSILRVSAYAGEIINAKLH